MDITRSKVILYSPDVLFINRIVININFKLYFIYFKINHKAHLFVLYRNVFPFK